MEQILIAVKVIPEKRFVFVTDRELALMNTITSVFPNAANLLCIWHINKNILVQTRKVFTSDSDDDWNSFMRLWVALSDSKTEAEYKQRWEEVKANVPTDVATYVENTWLTHKENSLASGPIPLSTLGIERRHA